MTNNHYDLLVIGAGAAGSNAATVAAENGARVALVERDELGGTCLNYGCDPTKTLLHIAALLYQARHADQYGLRIPEANYDWSAVQTRVHQVINQIRGGSSEEGAQSLAKQGIEVILSQACFTSAHELTAGGRNISADRIIIAAGCKALVPPIEGLKEHGFITNVEAVSLPALPARLAVIGGGAIGIEFAQMFHRFGVEVTVIERSPHLLDKEDRELADALCAMLVQSGIHMETGAELRRVQRGEHGKKVTYHLAQGGDKEIEVDEILLSLGREPALEALHVEVAGVQTSRRGIVVDETLRTTVPHIWAAGDVTGDLQFTHYADAQGKLAAHNAFAEHPQSFAGHVIPWVTYTDPALAHVGRTEEELRQAGVQYKVSRLPFAEIERAIIDGRTDGLVKLLVDQQGAILGGHILGVDADNLLAPIVVAMQAGLPARALGDTILPYPTLSESVRWAADKTH
ncbi:MAG TPA: FAD-dependent oxidoreductase [Ktedonobacteraceae bacterium]|jgi:pyruvate/2-oxoglutarate dehydrogenase complex dihydrolipoamide dehydrogenase (E3) component|nr:FAD-dependent oxidoreductase [Ktedonobacteraceae bacterium]